MASELIDTAQAILTATDTAISKAYRDEDRVWRKEDLGWREQERQLMCAASSPLPAHTTQLQLKQPARLPDPTLYVTIQAV